MQSKCNKPPVPPTKQENGGSHRAAFSRSLRWPSACQLQWRNSTPVGNKMCVNEQRTRHSAVRSLKRNGLSGVSGIALGPEHPHGGARSSFRDEWAGPIVGHVLGSAIPNSLGPDTPCPWHSCMLRSPVFGSRGVRVESITQEVHIRSERDGGEDLM